MRNFLANIVNAWIRGTLHALNGVLFAKYLTLSLGIDAASAAVVGGCASGVVIMRGHLLSAALAAVRLFRAAPDYAEPNREPEGRWQQQHECAVLLQRR